MASILGDGTGPGGPGPSRCLLLLQRSLAIQLTRGPPPHLLPNAGQRESPKEHPADEMWMYDKGYNLFQVSQERYAPRYPCLGSYFSSLDARSLDFSFVMYHGVIKLTASVVMRTAMHASWGFLYICLYSLYIYTRYCDRYIRYADSNKSQK